LDVKAGKRRSELYTLGTILEEGFDEAGNSVFKMSLTEMESEQIQKWDEILEYQVISSKN
jgi:GTP-binding protein HflX